MRALAWVCAFTLFAGSALAADQRVRFDSLDQADGKPVPLDGHWFPAPADAPAPALVLLHGCGGAFDKQRRLATRYREMAQMLNAQGWSALVLDSLGPRGERELCTQRIGTRAITMTQRRRDALAALNWLATQPGVDRERLGLIGWSNGGSTVLASSNLNNAEVAAAALRPRALLAFYPGCEADLKRGYSPSAPLQMLVGGADDWTAAAPCEALAAADVKGRIAVRTYPGAYHGFDGTDPVKLRKDVPNGVHPGAGVHVGGNPEAREQSRQQALDFLHMQFDRR